ncbi:ATP-dependent helicase [Luteolibacter pohnpeiensis]|uniref:DNA 3'-5' helicase n=1 Tax=Luteolibacter pohnpeiensis TaxID=454153 RepID=A0A934S748_9BACT|nr:ATP-dependent helicase [Luteolibacter pohnpeiensis]MBK1882031.1 ATP-dependent helicase [Luteolibacter pohnpeiensis]
MAREYTIHRTTPAAHASGIDYVAALNTEQYAAVSSPPGKALVIAGAGSGKTRTLTYRVAWLLDHGVESRQILLLTFTNKASREMIERVRELVPQDISDLWAGTFHSIGNRILRRHAEDLGFTRSFSILDRDDQKSLLSAVVASCEIDTKQRRFPKPDVLASIFSLIENTGATLEQVVAGRYAYFYDWIDEIAKVKEGYAAKKQATNSMDFDDLLGQTVRLFEEQPEVLALYQKRFRHLLVDEYQDTNSVQGRMIFLLTGGSNSLMAVGDDAQSIYSWRGADMDHILSFPTTWPGSKVFKIETNYRSVPEILDLSNAAIRANTAGFEKDLRSSRQGTGIKPALVAVEDPNTQAAFVAQRILELRDEGIELEEMAVLYRAHFQSLEVQMELTRRGIPFGITSGLRFFEQAHIKDVAAFLRFVTNRKDEVSFKRMTMLLPGIGPGAAEKLWQSWLNSGFIDNPQPPPKWSDLFLQFKAPKKSAKHWEQLCYTLDELSPDGEFVAPSQMIFSVLEGVYDDYIKENFDNYDNRRSDIEQLSQYGGNFTDIEEFLAQLSLMSAVDGEPTGDRSANDDEKVTLSSIHQAKGLEWKAVFLIWLADGQFPNGRILDSDDQAALEEERRLFYVALTRAKDDLYLSYPMMNPKSYTGDIITRPSRFLEDFPAEMVEEWKVGMDRGWNDDEPF